MGPLATDATVGDLKAAVEAHPTFKEMGLSCSMIAAPAQKIECEKDEENPAGVKTGARSLYAAVMRGTHANLTEPWVSLLQKLTTRSETWQTVDDPIDLSGRVLYSGLSFDMQDDDGEQVITPPIVVKLKEFDFVPYPERQPKAITPWLAGS